MAYFSDFASVGEKRTAIPDPVGAMGQAPDGRGEDHRVRRISCSSGTASRTRET